MTPDPFNVWATPTPWLVFGTLIVWIAFDVWVYLAHGWRGTISAFIGYGMVSMPFMVGVPLVSMMGHFIRVGLEERRARKKERDDSGDA